jgi:hypothetical protein
MLHIIKVEERMKMQTRFLAAIDTPTLIEEADSFQNK